MLRTRLCELVWRQEGRRLQGGYASMPLQVSCLAVPILSKSCDTTNEADVLIVLVEARGREFAPGHISN